VAHQASAKVLAKAKHLKEEANKKHQAGRFEEAIKLYTDALALPLLPKEELAVLHSNRSAAHLADGDLSHALQDGKEAQRLRPTWPKGYFRKGQVLSLQRNWPKALKGTLPYPRLARLPLAAGVRHSLTHSLTFRACVRAWCVSFVCSVRVGLCS
jgi:tetratricopeptide (TPR) repeat protein